MDPETAFVVWQLRGLVEDVHCYFFKRPSSFRLVVERAGERLMEETYHDLQDLLRRAGELRRNLVNLGFTPIGLGATGAGPGLATLLRHFVREGTATLHTGPAA